MILFSIISVMIIVAILGKYSKIIRLKHYAIIIFLTLIEVSLVIYDIFTKKVPPPL
jgi:hypothetical protein